MSGPALRVARARPLEFKRGDHVELAESTVSLLRGRGPTVYADGQIYRYLQAAGVFESVDSASLSRIVQSFAGASIAGGKRKLSIKSSDVTGTIKLAQDQLFDLEFFSGASKGLAFAGSFVEVTGAGISEHEHSPKHRARYAYPFEYCPDARPELFLRFLTEVFSGDSDASEKIQVLQEHIGISMLGQATKYQYAIVLHGPGANGKGVFADIAQRVMPPGSCSAIAPQKWGDEYQLALLAGKLLNIVSELPESEILDGEAFKAVVTGDATTCRPIRCSPFTFRPVAGHVFSANRLPGSADQTHGFWRRFIVVKFDRIFAKDEQDLGLADRIIAAELPAIASWFLHGAQRALARGAFVVPPSSQAAIAEWRRTSDQVRAYLDEQTALLPLDAHPTTWIAASKLYQDYQGWALRNGHRPMAANTFGARLELCGLHVKQTSSHNVYPVKIEYQDR